MSVTVATVYINIIILPDCLQFVKINFNYKMFSKNPNDNKLEKKSYIAKK